MTTNISIRLKRASKIYHEGEIVVGVVVVESPADVRHEGLSLTLEGAVSLTLSSKNVGLFDAFSNNIKPITLANTSMELAAAGRLPAGATEIPFELPLQGRAGAGAGGLPETYHGVFVNVTYSLRVAARRSLFNKPLHASCQLFLQRRPQESAPLKPVRCEITPSTIRAGGAGDAGGGGAARGGSMPHFHIYAEIDSTVCALDKPITGVVRVDECSAVIKSLELQLVRVETCGGADGCTRDATEIQNIQVGEGDPRRMRDVPLYMVLPRLFTCPTTAAANYKIEFELNIAVIFEDDYLVTENFPILLVRSK